MLVEGLNICLGGRKLFSLLTLLNCAAVPTALKSPDEQCNRAHFVVQGQIMQTEPGLAGPPCCQKPAEVLLPNNATVLSLGSRNALL